MRAGKLRNRIVIQQVTESNSDSGAVQESWATFATVWADIEPTKGREYFQSAQYVEELTLVIGIRYYPNIVPKMRVQWQGRTFDIKSVINVGGMDTRMILGCIERFNVAVTEHAFTNEFTAEFA